MPDNTKKTARPGATPADGSDDIELQLHAIRADLAAMAEMMGAFVTEKVHAFGATAEAAADDVSARARKMRDRVDRGVEQAEKVLDDRVQEHPLQSILMAFGLGLLVSLLFRR